MCGSWSLLSLAKYGKHIPSCRRLDEQMIRCRFSLTRLMAGSMSPVSTTATASTTTNSTRLKPRRTTPKDGLPLRRLSRRPFPSRLVFGVPITRYRPPLSPACAHHRPDNSTPTYLSAGVIRPQHSLAVHSYLRRIEPPGHRDPAYTLLKHTAERPSGPKRWDFSGFEWNRAWPPGTTSLIAGGTGPIPRNRGRVRRG